jgi:hypothetical protein
MKINYPHIKLPNSLIFDHFKHKIVLYRTDIFQSAVSRIVAEKRKSWVVDNKSQIQLEFNEKISMTDMKRMIGIIVLENQTLRNYYDTSLTNFVVNYETDLVPYVNANEISMFPSNNYIVQNYDDLKQEIITDRHFLEHQMIINEYFTKLKSVNTKSFSDYLIELKENLNGK